MTNTADVERVARVLCGYLTSVPWDELPDTKQEYKALFRDNKIDHGTPTKTDLREMAHAAIAAMPTQADAYRKAAGIVRTVRDKSCETAVWRELDRALQGIEAALPLPAPPEDSE